MHVRDEVERERRGAAGRDVSSSSPPPTTRAPRRSSATPSRPAADSTDGEARARPRRRAPGHGPAPRAQAGRPLRHATTPPDGPRGPPRATCSRAPRATARGRPRHRRRARGSGRPTALAGKVKSPLELAVERRPRDRRPRSRTPRGLVQQVEAMGQPLYRYPAPTGFPDRADAWLSAGTVAARVRFGLALATGGVPGVRLDATRLGRAGAATAPRRPSPRSRRSSSRPRARPTSTRSRASPRTPPCLAASRRPRSATAAMDNATGDRPRRRTDRTERAASVRATRGRPRRRSACCSAARPSSAR